MPELRTLLFLLVVSTTHSSHPSPVGEHRARKISGWTSIGSCGNMICKNMTQQLTQLISHADTIHTVYVGAGAGAPQYNANHSLCYNGTGTLPTGIEAFPWATFRFGVGPNHLGPSEGDGSGRYFCVPKPDALVTAWAGPLQAAGIKVMPILNGAAAIWPIAGRDDGFFEAAVRVAKQFGFAGWSLDVEPTIQPPGSGAAQLAK